MAEPVESIEPTEPIEPIELVIFDCDGVLVDTERLSVRIDGEVLADLGIPMTPQEVIDRFVGRTEEFWREEVSRLLGRAVSKAEFAAYDPWYRAAFEAELTAIDGIAEAIDGLVERGIQTCVASSGTHERMDFTLGHTGLYPRFAGRIFSATEVAEGKPSPLLFRYAASRMAVPPARCLVIEDSRYGVQAARAAGMRVVGYSGSVVSAEALHAEGASVVIDDMRKIPDLIDIV